jgi:hypothetical protein
MKMRNIALPVLLLAFLMYGCGNNLFSSIADDDSNEACIYETSKNLDKGDYDAVLASSCLDSLQKGAAYLGKSSFDVKDVINSLSEAQDTTADLDIYLNTLVSVVSESSLNYLELAASAYDEVAISSDSYEDAQFYKSIMKSLRSLSLLKLVTDIDGDGSLSGCDINSNGTPDDVDAVVCSLLDVANQSCVDASAARTPTDITIQGKSGTYRGVTVTLNGTATPSCPADYKQLHYLISGTTYGSATVTSDTCQETAPNTARTWPCPVESGTAALDLVEAFDEAITDSIDALGNSFDTNNDIFDSIQDIKTDACGVDAVCTSTEIADYLNQL